MNELTNHIHRVMMPKAALIAYEYTENNYSTPDSYLELRPINKKGKMGAGIPVTYDFMDSLLESYSQKSTQNLPKGRIPKNLLWCDQAKGSEKYIWYNPPQKRRMYFCKGLGIPEGIFNLPGILYVVKKEALYVHAFKGKYPKDGTELYLAPFFNVTNGSVCLGNSSLKKPQDMDFLQLLDYWEKRFWLSEFSHLGGNKNPTRGNLVSVTEHARSHPFDYSELKKTGKKLKDLFT